MSFISWSFLGLYLLALAVRWGPACLLGRVGREASAWRVLSLLALSWVFYAWHVPWYVLLILTSTMLNYFAARGIETALGRRRSVILAMALGANLGLLCWFKYAGFLASSVNSLAGSALPVPDILLPIGISFYTFQAMSYVVDVYRGRIAAEKRLLNLACYIAFFPQLVAGPIVRAAEFLYQLDRNRRFHSVVFMEGAYLILRGLFLKMVVADNLGLIIDPLWDRAGQDGEHALAFTLLVFYACQLFCDFAGYVDIARGLAYQLGFRLPVNFNAPYVAATFAGFWRRWHITLSRWMRDYLYIPLGGNRRSKWRTGFNLMAVMLLSGLWHGANWTFVAWGGLLGAALGLERLLGLHRGRGGPLVKLSWFCVVQLTWILSMGLFRAVDIEQGGAIMGNAVHGLAAVATGGFHYTATSGVLGLGWWFTLPVWLLHLRSLLAERTLLGAAGRPERAVWAGVMLAAVLVLYAEDRQFIYFQF